MPESALQEERKSTTSEEVWALLKEIGEKQKETDRQLREQAQETDKRMEKQWEKTSKVLGDLGIRLGEIVESLIAPNLIEKFNAMNFNFRVSSPNRKYYDSNNRELTEVDVLLESDNVVMAVEAKSKLKVGHVQRHIERMNILRAYADEHNDRRVLLGAIGGAVLDSEARQAALGAGFYLIEQAGDTMKISVPAGFEPKEWTFGMAPQTYTPEIID
jgi:hypothetical protein